NHRAPSARGEATPEPPASHPQTTSPQEETSSEDGTRWATVGTRWVTVAGLAAVALLLAGIYLWLIGGEDKSPPPRTQLSVSSEPPGADVLLNGDPIGTTPLSETVEGDTARIQVRRAGFVPFVDTVTQLDSRDTVKLNPQLVMEPTPLVVETDPKGADVYLGAKDTLIGATTLKSVIGGRLIRRYAEEESRVRIGIQKEGYRPKDTLVAMAQVDSVRLDWRLERKQTRPPTPSYGTLTLNTSPSTAATVSVDGNSHAAGQSIQVTAGEPHRIRIQHPSRGTCDTTLAVDAGGSETLTCYFEHEVRVRTGLTEPWANVYIDEENTDQPTPHDTRLATGKTYKIGARIQRDPDKMISGGTHEERDTAVGPTQFAGQSTTLTLRPGFERKTHIIDFRVRSEP
ncbi:MAG: PEGA domain-containing protein, partial [Salinibacter sp.]|uniref:PEGA domain-containing protein n=1 Tax=Salinibacter sp. TaxID=2065818 RepID=UPI0035D3F40E